MAGCARMVHMEITLLSKDSLRIKGKHTTLGINPADKSAVLNASILIGNLPSSRIKIPNDSVVIDGPGEYEVGGIKISGMRNNRDIVYQCIVDGITVSIGSIAALDKTQTKLGESDIVVVLADMTTDASFITNFSPRAVVFFGENGSEVVQTFAKENVKELSKYQTTLEKLPVEMETVLLK